MPTAAAARRPVRVSLGAVVATPGVLAAVPHAALLAALARPARGDWGDVCANDARANDEALDDGGRLLSSYATEDGTKFWIITEADRASTCALLPEEY